VKGKRTQPMNDSEAIRALLTSTEKMIEATATSILSILAVIVEHTQIIKLNGANK